MKSFSSAAMDEIQAGTAIVGGAVEIGSDPVIRLWSGYGPLTFDSRTFDPIGDRGIAQLSGGMIGGTAQNVTLSLSGIEPEVLALLDAAEVQRAPVILWRLIFSGDQQTLLDYHVYTRGRLDKLDVAEMIGGTATISCNVESAARALGRKGGRVRSDADQRLVKANDGFFKNVAFAAEKTLYWGGKKPANAGAALAAPAAGQPVWNGRYMVRP
jgi:hypothetical protein